MRVSLVKCRSCRTGCSCTAETGICTVPGGAVRNTWETAPDEDNTSLQQLGHMRFPRWAGQRLTRVLGLCMGHLHGGGSLGEGVEHGQPSVSQRRRGRVHDCVRAGVHHVTRHRRRHRRSDDGCWETYGCCIEREGGVAYSNSCIHQQMALKPCWLCFSPFRGTNILWGTNLLKEVQKLNVGGWRQKDGTYWWSWWRCGRCRGCCRCWRWAACWDGPGWPGAAGECRVLQTQRTWSRSGFQGRVVTVGAPCAGAVTSSSVTLGCQSRGRGWD